MTLDEIKQAIMGLTLDERARLHAWLEQIEAQRLDPAGEPESTAEKLGRFAGRTFADLRKRIRED